MRLVYKIHASGGSGQSIHKNSRFTPVLSPKDLVLGAPRQGAAASIRKKKGEALKAVKKKKSNNMEVEIERIGILE